MKRFLTATLILGLFAPVALVGCGEESKVTEKSTVSTPGGSETVTKETKINQTGDMKDNATGGAPAANP